MFGSEEWFDRISLFFSQVEFFSSSLSLSLSILFSFSLSRVSWNSEHWKCSVQLFRHHLEIITRSFALGKRLKKASKGNKCLREWGERGRESDFILTLIMICCTHLVCLLSFKIHFLPAFFLRLWFLVGRLILLSHFLFFLFPSQWNSKRLLS